LTGLVPLNLAPSRRSRQRRAKSGWGMIVFRPGRV